MFNLLIRERPKIVKPLPQIFTKMKQKLEVLNLIQDVDSALSGIYKMENSYLRSRFSVMVITELGDILVNMNLRPESIGVDEDQLEVLLDYSYQLGQYCITKFRKATAANDVAEFYKVRDSLCSVGEIRFGQALDERVQTLKNTKS